MRVLSFLLIILLLPHTTQATDKLILPLIIAHSTDVGTSLIAFQRGYREKNPFIISQRPVIFISQVAATTVLEIVLLRQLAKKHPKAARVLSLVQISTSLTATTWNIMVMNNGY